MSQPKAKSSGFENVSVSQPCIICQKSDWCRRSKDGGMVVCRRVSWHGVYGPGRPGTDSNGAQYYKFPIVSEYIGGRCPQVDPNPEKEPAPKRPVRKATLSPDRYTRHFTPDCATELSLALQLPTWAFDGHGIGAEPLRGEQGSWRTGFGDYSWVFPERDGARNVIGFHVRFPDGTKRHKKNTGRGLFIPNGWDQTEAPLYLVEGASDALAMFAAGHAAIGRPSNLGGVSLLNDLLAGAPLDRPIIVVGENDRKDDGHWPGREGAYRSATGLAAFIGRPVAWGMVPADAKDVRAWLISRVGRNSPREAWRKAGRELADALKSDEILAQPTYPGVPKLQPQPPRCFKAVNIRLQGKRGTRAAGKRTASAFVCDSWTCSACQPKKSNRILSWLFRCVLQWADPLRMHEMIPRIEAGPGTGTEAASGVEAGGPWNLYVETMAGTEWSKTIKRLEKKRSGNSRHFEYAAVDRPGSRTLAVVALAPGAIAPPGLTRTSADDAIRMLQDAFEEMPQVEAEFRAGRTDDSRFRPVSQSRSWLIREEVEAGNWRREGSCAIPLSEANDAIDHLGGSDLGDGSAPRAAQDAVVWNDGAIGGSLASWIASALMDRKYTHRTLNAYEVTGSTQAWQKMLAEHAIPDSPAVRYYIGLCLARYPDEALDLDSLIQASTTETESAV